MKRIVEDVYLDMDEHNLILRRKKIVKKDGSKRKERYELIGYYSNIDAVANKLRSLALKKWVESDFGKCCEYIDKAYENLKIFNH